MKKLLVLISFSVSLSVSSQIIGLQGGASFTHTDNATSVGLGSSTGLFYNKKIYKRLWIGTGIYTSCWNLQRTFYYNFADVYPPDFYTITKSKWHGERDVFYLIEIPAELRLRLNPSESSKFRSFVTAGYTYSQILGETVKVIDPYFGNRRYNEEITSADRHSHNIETFGYELQYLPTSGFFFAWGAQYKYAVFRNKQYGDINNWNAYFKFGYNLRSTKK